MSAPLVHLSGVRHTLGPRFTLQVDEASFGPGVTAVLGPNGSGKSTLLRLLATVLAPATGTITVAGEPPVGPALVAVRRRLGYVPQDDSVPRRLTVFDHVDLVAVMRELHGDPRRRRALVHRALRDQQLDTLASERCGRLSGGQRRRVAVAAALAGAADLLVLDEPDAHLDGEHRDRLAALLRARAATATVVLATHDHAWASAVADREVHVVGGVVRA